MAMEKLIRRGYHAFYTRESGAIDDNFNYHDSASRQDKALIWRDGISSSEIP
jgi:hypothetical protein